MEMNNNKIIWALLFLGGVAVGTNYPKVRKQLKPLTKKISKRFANDYAVVAKFFVGKKERAEDLLAKTIVKKAEKVEQKAEKVEQKAKPKESLSKA